MYIATRRLYLNRNNRIVEADDLTQDRLLVGAGGALPDTQVRALALTAAQLEAFGLRAADDVAPLPVPSAPSAPAPLPVEPGLGAQVTALRSRLDEMAAAMLKVVATKGEKGDAGATPTTDQLVALIQPLLPAAVKGERGDDGHTPTSAELQALITPLIPAPVPGAAGHTPTTGELQAVIQPLIPAAVPGKDGRTPTPQELQALIAPLIPAPVAGKDGKTPTAAELTALIQPLIPAAVPGKDGRTPTEAELRGLIQPLIPPAVKGDQGSVGKSAYDLWRDAGNTGTVTEFLASLKGTKGDTGTTDHAQLLNLATGDPHTQYLTPGRGDARYAQLAAANSFAQPQTFTGASGNGGAVGILVLFNGQARVVKASSKGVLGLLGANTRMLYFEDP